MLLNEDFASSFSISHAAVYGEQLGQIQRIVTRRRPGSAVEYSDYGESGCLDQRWL